MQKAPDNSSNKKYTLFVLLTVAAFFFRYFYVHLVVCNESWIFDILLSDSYVYVRNALQILKGEYLGQRVFYQDPLYQLCLALLFFLNNRALYDILIINCILSALTALNIYLSALKLFSQRTALIAYIIFVIYPPSLFYDALLLKIPFNLFLTSIYILLIIFASSKRTKLFLCLSTVTLALLLLLRGNYILWLPLHFAFLFYLKVGKQQLLYNILLLFLIISPVTFLNYRAGNDFILVTSQAGQNIYTGNNPFNDTGYYKPVPFVRPSALFEENDFHREAEKRSGRNMKPSEVSSFWLRETLKYFYQQPLIFIKNLIKKTIVFFDYYEVPDNYDFYYFKNRYFIGYFSFLNYTLLWGLAILGVNKLKGAIRNYLLLLLLVYSASVIISFVFSRYRMPTLPFLTIFSAGGISVLFAYVKKRSFYKLSGFIVLIFLVFLLLLNNPFKLRVHPDLMKSYVEQRLKKL